MLRKIPRHTPVRVLGGVARSYRVVLPNGLSGYLDARLTEPIAAAVTNLEIAERRQVLDSPAPDADAIGHVGGGETVEVLGRYGEYLMVPSGIERPGWVFVLDP